MTFEEYQKACLRTWPSDLTTLEQLENCALGLGEIGEVQNIIKKWRFHGHDLDKGALIDELGDIAYYVAIVVSRLHIEHPSLRVSNSPFFSGSIDSLPHLSFECNRQVSKFQDVIYSCLAHGMVDIVPRNVHCLVMMWNSVCLMSQCVNSSIEQVMYRNVSKLQRRYPDGFEKERSRNRDED